MDVRVGLKLCCWKRLLRVPWTAKTSKQSILKEGNPEYSLQGLMLKLKLQSFGHHMQRANSLEKTLMLGKIKGKRRRGLQRRWLDSITDSIGMSLSKLWEIVGSHRVGHHWATFISLHFSSLGDSEGQESLVSCSPWDHRFGHHLVTEQQQHGNSSFNFLRNSILFSTVAVLVTSPPTRH